MRHTVERKGFVERMKEAGRSVKHEVTVYRLVIRDDRAPRMAKVLLGVAVGYRRLQQGFDLSFANRTRHSAN